MSSADITNYMTPTAATTKRQRANSSPEPAAEVTNADIVRLMTQMQISLNKKIDEKFDDLAMRTDKQFTELKTDFGNLQATVASLTVRQQELADENRQLKAELANIKTEMKSIADNRNEAIEKEAEARDDLEAQQRRYNLTISGITQLTKDENCKELVNRFLKQLVPTHDDNTLDICHRTAAGQLICRFTSRTARDAIYAERSKLRNMTTDNFNLPGNSIKNKLYINESLTFTRAKIFKSARVACNTFNDLHGSAHRVFIYKGYVTAATPTINEVKGKLTMLKTENSVHEYFSKLR